MAFAVRRGRGERLKKFDVTYRVGPRERHGVLDALFAGAWMGNPPPGLDSAVGRSLGFVCAYREECLAGFVDLA